MEIIRTQKIEKIFNKATSSNQIHEGVLFVENTILPESKSDFVPNINYKNIAIYLLS